MSRTVRSLIVVILVSLVCLPALADAGQFRFSRSEGVRPVAILTAEDFEARFGANAEMPRSDEAVIALARRLFRPHWARQYEPARPEAAAEDGCGEYQIGLLFAALANPAISDVAREEVDVLYADSVPPLPRTYTSGKFKIFYTTSNANPDHNVTLAQVQTLASRLNSYWSSYAAGFREPKHYHWIGTLPRVDVKIYYLGSGLYGQTNSGWNHIELNSKQVVRDACKGRTTPAHELFHRVQYAYGYVTGTANMKWIVEGTAAWSQRFTNWSIGDYMDRMNQGLTAPDLNLITTRSYNACHLWVFLQQRAGSYAAIRSVWSRFSTVGPRNSAGARAALEWYTRARLGSAYNFDYFSALWHRANLFKDFVNAGTNYEYSEDERIVTTCSVRHGPLSHVPRSTGSIATNSSATVTRTGSVNANGADYYDFTLGPGVTHVRVVADGATGKNFTYFFVLAKANSWRSYAPRIGTDFTYTSSFTAGSRDKLYVIVVGNTGGSYTLRIGP